MNPAQPQELRLQSFSSVGLLALIIDNYNNNRLTLRFANSAQNDKLLVL